MRLRQRAASSLAGTVRLSPLQRNLSSAAAPSAVTALVDRVLGRSKMPRVPLNEPFSARSGRVEEWGSNQDLEASVLPNGLAVVSRDAPQSPIANVSIHFEAGSRYENPTIQGTASVLESLAFMSTHHRSDFRLKRDMDRIGASLSARASREMFSYSVEVLKPFVMNGTRMLGEAVLHPALYDFDVRNNKLAYKKEVKAYLGDPTNRMSELLYSAAYSRNTLGNPLHASDESLANMTSEFLHSYRSAFFSADRGVVVGSGLSHSELVGLANDWFGGLEKSTQPGLQKTDAAYTGGDVRTHVPSGQSCDPAVHVSLAFEGAAFQDLKSSLAMALLYRIMAGDQGFGMSGSFTGSRTSRVARQLPALDATCFNMLHSDSSLFGVKATCNMDDAKESTEAIVKALVSMPEGIEQVELQRAKAQLRAHVLSLLENRAALVEDMALQMLFTKQVLTPQEVCEQIEQVQVSDVASVASTMLSKPLTVAAFGDLTFLPRYDQILDLLKR